MTGQEIIVGIILLVCVGWIARRMVLCVKRIRRGGHPCEGCGCGCARPCHRPADGCEKQKKMKLF